MKKALLLIFTLLIQACAGVNLSVHGEHTPNQIELSSKSGNVSGAYVKEEIIYNKESVIALWGKPDKVSTSGESETWLYKRELKWRGAVVSLLVPIPLVIPVGKNYALLSFQGNTLTQVTEQYNRTPFLGCAPIDGIYVCGKMYNSF